jgi:hypothetical protein
MARLNIGYDLLTYEGDILRLLLGACVRVLKAKAPCSSRPRQARYCWVCASRTAAAAPTLV